MKTIYKKLCGAFLFALLLPVSLTSNKIQETRAEFPTFGATDLCCYYIGADNGKEISLMAADLIQDDEAICFYVLNRGEGCFYSKDTYDDSGSWKAGTWLNDHKEGMAGIYSDGGGKNFGDYFFINDYRFSDICNENAATAKYDATNIMPPWLGGTFCPVSIYANGDKLEVHLMGAWLKDKLISPKEISFEIKKGAPLRKSNGEYCEMATDVICNVTAMGAWEANSFAVKNGPTTYDITLRDTCNIATKGDGIYFQMWFNSAFSAKYAGQFILDHRTNLAGYFLLNGKSLDDWCAETDYSTWNFAGFSPIPDNANYVKPIYLQVDGGNQACIYLNIHNNLWNTILEGTINTIGFKAGFVYETGNSGDPTAEYLPRDQFAFFKKTSSGVEFYVNDDYGEDTIGFEEPQPAMSESNLYSYIDVKLTKPIDVTKFELFDGNDSTDSHFNRVIKNSVTINGTSVGEINENTDVSAYDFSTRFPQNADTPYAKPVIFEHIRDYDANKSTFRFIIHNNYLRTLGSSVTVGFDEGLAIYNSHSHYGKMIIDVIYKTTQAYSFSVNNIDFNELDVKIFVDDYMHMTDYNENLNYCSDSEHHYYSSAKTALDALTTESKIIFATDERFADSYARLQAWATANGENFVISAAGVVTYSAPFNPINALTNNDTILIAVLVVMSLLSISGIYFLKRKRS